MTFSERLKEIREDKDYSRKDLAAAINLSTAAISNYENGNREPDLITLIQISEYLNVSIDYLTDVNVPPQDMKKPFYKEVSTGHLLNKMINLNSQSRRLLIELLDCIETKQLISERAKK
ncbi:MAG: helix-turn-helix domain-containing protein [Oscillospiraceae bacterium]|nr:helix-turn-helix domain-containing protein [Oscillospiraceae bacterium]